MSNIVAYLLSVNPIIKASYATVRAAPWLEVASRHAWKARTARTSSAGKRRRQDPEESTRRGNKKKQKQAN